MVNKISPEVDVRGNGQSSTLWQDQGRYILACNIPRDDCYHALSIIDHQPIHWMRTNNWRTNKTIFCTENVPGSAAGMGLTFDVVYRRASRMNSGLHAAEYLAYLGAKTVNLWGFDSMFSNDLTSVMDQWIPRHTRPNLNQWWHPHWSRIALLYPQVHFCVHAPQGKKLLINQDNITIEHHNHGETAELN